jgi:hypothetical protein
MSFGKAGTRINIYNTACPKVEMTNDFINCFPDRIPQSIDSLWIGNMTNCDDDDDEW